jgi:hypothetical protein
LAAARPKKKAAAAIRSFATLYFVK